LLRRPTSKSFDPFKFGGEGGDVGFFIFRKEKNRQ